VFYISICGVEILFAGLSSEFWVRCDNVSPQLGLWRAVDTALVPDIEGIQNKGIYL